jgi:hypothetical protein
LREATVLPVGRQLAGYIIAADLGRVPARRVRRFVSDIRTSVLGNHTGCEKRMAYQWHS